MWEKFKDVTGFVPSNCYQVISHKEGSLDEVLEVEIKRTIDEAREYMREYRKHLETDALKDRFDDYMDRGHKLKMDTCCDLSPAILPKSDWRCGCLDYLSFSIETRDGVDYFFNPIGLSTGAALGMKVFKISYVLVECQFEF